MKKQMIGFVGLGEMGKWMALNILKNGFGLMVYDVSKDPVDELRKMGAQAAQDLGELSRQCKCIVLSLPDTSVVKTVVFGAKGLMSGLRKGHVVVDSGTTHPIFTAQTAVKLKKRGITFLDAPVSGMEARAEQGTLTIMVGGSKAA